MAYEDDPRLWDGSDPLYAPGLAWSNRVYPRWTAPAKYRKAGYSIAGVKLDGKRDDGNDLARAARCRELTADMVKWYRDLDKPKVTPNTWAHALAIFKSDRHSPIHRKKPVTLRHYLNQIAKLELAIGHVSIADTSFDFVMDCKVGMDRKGRSADYVQRFFAQWREVAKYARVQRLDGADVACTILDGVRTPTTPPRSVFATREQVMAIVAEADRRGLHSFALGVLMCFEFSLRAVDVRGQWEPTEDVEGGIVRNGKRWIDGLTWDMIDFEAMTIRKVISKTAKRNPDPYVFSLEYLPEITSRLKAIKHRVGPVILTDRHNLPFTETAWSHIFLRIKRHLIAQDEKMAEQGQPTLELDPDLKVMDLRASAVTESKHLVSDPFLIRDSAQHLNVSTTDKYARDRSASANKVVQIRQQNTK